jgi:hypothetical protein
LYVVEERLAAIEDKKIRTAIYKQLLEKYGIAESTARQRILLVRRMKQKRALSGVIFEHAEEEGKPSAETLTLLDQACEKKSAVELQREHGLRQPLTDKVKTTTRTKKPTVETPLSLEDRLVHELSVALDSLTKLMGIREELLAAGEVIDGAFKEVLDHAAETVSAIAAHPLIKAKFKTDEDTKEAGAAEALANAEEEVTA